MVTFTLEDLDSHIPSISTRISETLSDITISEEKKIFYKLLSLNGNKAPGPDALHPYFLKSCAASLAYINQTIIELWYTTRPLEEKANVTPIFKKGNKFQPSNYRPISLTSQVVKFIESIIKEQLWEFLDQSQVLNPSQHGFVKHKSTC